MYFYQPTNSPRGEGLTLVPAAVDMMDLAGKTLYVSEQVNHGIGLYYCIAGYFQGLYISRICSD